MYKKFMAYSAVIVPTCYLLFGLILIEYSFCDHIVGGACLEEEELVQDVYEFSEDDYLEAADLARQMTLLIEAGEESFTLTYQGKDLEIEHAASTNINGLFIWDPAPGTIGKIKTDGSYATSYHEALHALQSVKISQRSNGIIMTGSLASSRPKRIGGWSDSGPSNDDLAWINEFMPYWETCRVLVADGSFIPAVCSDWDYYQEDPHVYEDHVPPWESEKMQSWRDKVVQYHISNFGE